MKDISQHTVATRRYFPKIGYRLGAMLALFLTLSIAACEKLAVEQELKVGRICTWDVPSGQRYAFQDVPPGIDTVAFKARMYAPSLPWAGFRPCTRNQSSSSRGMSCSLASISPASLGAKSVEDSL